MSNKVIDAAVNKVRNSKSVVATWLFLLVIWIVVAVISLADWRASVHGFDQLPINTLDWWWLGEFIGALPQLTQGLAFLFFTSSLSVRSKWWIAYAILWVVSFGFDAFTDYTFFLQDPPTTESRIVSFTLAVFIFTLFSEWVIAIVTPVLLTTLPEVLPEFGTLGASILDGGTKFLNSFSDDNNSSSQRSNANRNNTQPKREPPREQPHPENRTPPERRRI